MDKTTTPNPNEDFLAQWIEGLLTDEELRALVSEQDFVKFTKLRSGIDLHERLESPIDSSLTGIKKKIDFDSKNDRQHKTIPLYIKVSLAVAALLTLFFGIRSFLSDSIVTENSDFGEQRTISLLDGSSVILNAKSGLKYDKSKWDSQRELILEGEAFFKVKPGSNFTVKTHHGDIGSLGTQFNVNTFDDFFETVCYSGKVKVIGNEREFVVLPEQSVRKHKGTFASENLSLVRDTPTWIEGISSFRNVPLAHAIRELENQFNIQINDKNIDTSLPFTGSFDHGNLQGALAAVFSSLEISYSVSGNKIELSQ